MYTNLHRTGIFPSLLYLQNELDKVLTTMIYTIYTDIS